MCTSLVTIRILRLVHRDLNGFLFHAGAAREMETFLYAENPRCNAERRTVFESK